MPTVLLFDIDGTLVLTGGAGRRAMEAAFGKAFGDAGVFAELAFAGMTDRAIVRHGLSRLMAEVTEAAIDDALEMYLAALEDELPRSDQYRVLPGVREVLGKLDGQRDVAVGLGTGNVRRGAYAKLARGQLDQAFSFGGFGCDAEERGALLLAGARRGAALLGAAYEDCGVVVIGDTPKDVAAATAIGARCIGVATGTFSVDELTTSGADCVFATLEDPSLLGALLR